MVELRPYQNYSIAQIFNHYNRGVRSVLLYAPTASGKTIIGVMCAKEALSQEGRKGLFIVHRDPLVEQTVEAFEKIGITPGIIKAGFPEDRHSPIIVASIQTLAARELPENIGFIIADECHSLSYFQTFQDLINDHYQEAWILGLSATPWRMSRKENLSDLYAALVKCPEPAELISLGYLVPPRYFCYTGEVDLENIKLNKFGDYQVTALERQCNVAAKREKVVNEYLRLAFGRRSICFAVSVKHSKSLCEAFNQAGVPAEHIDAKTNLTQRREMYERLRSGQTLVLCSVDVLTEGFNVPEVSCIILARATRSRRLNHQQVGRGLRTAPGTGKEDCLILDFAESTLRHGRIDSPQRISLEDEILDTASSGQPIKICPQCNAAINIVYAECPECGYIFPPPDEESEDDDLKLQEAGEVVLAPEFDYVTARSLYRQLICQAFERLNEPEWATHLFEIETGRSFPPMSARIGAVFDLNPSSRNQQTYLTYLNLIAQRYNYPPMWVKFWMRSEFGDDWNPNTEDFPPLSIERGELYWLWVTQQWIDSQEHSLMRLEKLREHTAIHGYSQDSESGKICLQIAVKDLFVYDFILSHRQDFFALFQEILDSPLDNLHFLNTTVWNPADPEMPVEFIWEFIKKILPPDLGKGWIQKKKLVVADAEKPRIHLQQPPQQAILTKSEVEEIEIIKQAFSLITNLPKETLKPVFNNNELLKAMCRVLVEKQYFNDPSLTQKFITHTHLLGLQNGVLTLQIKDWELYSFLRECCGLLEMAFQEVTYHPIEVELQLAEGVTPPPPPPPVVPPIPKVVAEAPTPYSTSPPETVQKVDLSLWEEVLNHIYPPTTQALMSQRSTFLGFDGEVAYLGMTSPLLLTIAQGSVAKIEKAFEMVCNSPVRVCLLLGDSLPPEISRKLSKSSKTATERDFSKQVAKAAEILARTFNGDIIDFE